MSYSYQRTKHVNKLNVKTKNAATVKVGGAEPTVMPLPRIKQTDEAEVKKALAAKAEKELTVEQTAEIELKLNGKKTSFKVTGKQPLKPRIINYPGGWGVPDGVAADIRKELGNPNRKTASDAEVVAYLSGASMAGPLDEQWARIFMHVTGNYFKSKGIKTGDMDFLEGAKTLREDDKRELDTLRRRIFESQKKDLAERQRALKRETKRRSN